MMQNASPVGNGKVSKFTSQDKSWFFVKRKQYAPQKEARLVMHPISEKIKPEPVIVPKAIEYCSVIE